MRNPINRLKGHLQWHYSRGRRIIRSAWADRTLYYLKIRNLICLTRITHPNGPIVSLTSYGKRIDTVYLTIESIGRGNCKPSRLILWLDEDDVLLDPPDTLRRLVRRGLEILPTENYKSHKKYLPYILRCQKFEKPLTTADDDVIYPADWLRTLFAAYNENSNVINCFRARKIKICDGELAPFTSWPFCSTNTPSVLNFSEGVGGVIFPPRYLSALKLEAYGFMATCPQHDDVWLNVIALRNGFRVRQISVKAAAFPLIPETQEEGLWVANLGPDGDRQIRDTYSAADLDCLDQSKC